ncbi:response regulator [Dongia sedimenti]|uniref:histidine kinase n=1 Tax=Dongia sedimenti TaxID=3064282 RepID=A0ABU0YJG7_9PROT|nr:transporter substrate-binding domain-containing protein [Rhodospirillaceae bacterium R-7]
MKPLFGIAIALAALLSCSPRVAADFQPPKTLTVGLDDNYAPFSFRPEHGEVQGIMRDLWDLWSKRTGVTIRYEAIPRSRRLAALDAHAVDVVGYLMGSDSRNESYLMAPVPPVEIDVVIFFDRAISGIAGVESLEGFTIGVMGNGSCSEFLHAHRIDRLKVYPDWESLFTAVARHEVDVFCSGRAAGIRRLYRMNLQSQFKLSPPLYTTPAAWAVRKEDTALRDFIAAGFALIRPDERAAIEERWIGQPVESLWDNPALRFLAWMLLAAAIGAALLFTWNASLRRQVAVKTMGLATSERRYRELVEAVPVGIFESDAAGGNTYSNGVWVAMTGLSRTQSLGDGWLAAVHPEDRAGMLARWRAAIAAEQRYRSEHRLCRLDGTEIWVMVEAVPRFDARGAFSGYIGSLSDVTERRRHEEERRRLEAQGQESKKLEALGQFAGGVAHDFNNFLGAILGYAQFIVEDSAEQPQLQSAGRYAQRILTAGRRGRALVEQILTFTRRTKMTRRRFHLSELLGEIEELMFASALGSVEFRCENADPDAVVEADRDQLGQVLLNLCINAQDALRGRPGSVTVRIRRTALPVETAVKLAPAIRGEPRGESIRVWTDGDGTARAVAGSFDPALPHVSMSVTDTGFGMDATLLEQAFTPFFTTKEKGHGTGLGLAVVRGIVLAHGAALLAQSREGEGTTIEIVLPRIAIAIPRAEPMPVAAAARPRRRILLVDDDADFCDMMHLLLERLGFEVVPYTSAKEALADFREMPATWDALISDQNMPEMSGLELLAAVKALRPDLPCLICSAFSESLTDAALREAGALALIRKPVDKDLLLATLERALGAGVDRHARA